MKIYMKESFFYKGRRPKEKKDEKEFLVKLHSSIIYGIKFHRYII